MQIPLLNYLNVPYALQTLLLFDKTLSTTSPVPTPTPTPRSTAIPTSIMSYPKIHPSTAPWKPLLANALSADKSGLPTFFQFATVSAPLTPHCRTLTFNGFFGDSTDETQKVESTVLLTASHAASSKFADLAISPQFEAVFFFGSQWIQFRIRGKAFGVSPKLQGGEAETEGRRAAEAQLEVETATNGESRIQNWNWEEEIRRAWDRVGEKIKAKYGPVTEEEPVPKDFRVIVLVPEEVERLSMGEGVTMVWKADPTEGRWIVKSKL